MDHICTITDVRDHNRALQDSTKYQDSKILDAIEVAEQIMEEAAMVAFVPREKTVTLYGDGTRTLILPDVEVATIDAMSVNGVALTETELASLVVRKSGLLTGMYFTAGAELTITYTHGFTTPPAPIVRACITLAVEALIPSTIPARATATTVGDQFFRLTVAGRDGVTGIPEVDSAIEQFGRRRPVLQ